MIHSPSLCTIANRNDPGAECRRFDPHGRTNHSTTCRDFRKRRDLAVPIGYPFFGAHEPVWDTRHHRPLHSNEGGTQAGSCALSRLLFLPIVRWGMGRAIPSWP
jgi:hypothetical protein